MYNYGNRFYAIEVSNLEEHKYAYRNQYAFREILLF